MNAGEYQVASKIQKRPFLTSHTMNIEIKGTPD